MGGAAGQTRPWRRTAERISREQGAARSTARLQHVPPVKTRNSKFPPSSRFGAASGIRVDEIREKLRDKRGPEYWRSLEELAETPEFVEMMHREFPAGASEWWDTVSRRSFLKFASASLALAGLTACTKQPPHQILPYVRQPEGLVLGEPLFYATAITQAGFAQGVLVKSHEGRPTKIEGNPEHPISAGGSDVWMQAA